MDNKQKFGIEFSIDDKATPVLNTTGVSIEDLADSFQNTLKKNAREALESIEENTKKLANTVTSSTGDMMNGWGSAMARISVLKDSFAGIGKFASGFLEGPKQMETAMAQLTFVSKEVRENYDGVRDSLLAIGRSVPIKSTTELVNSMKDLAAAGFDVADSLKLVEEAINQLQLLGKYSIP
jgi:methyl-accepting chemotaxis protein